MKRAKKQRARKLAKWRAKQLAWALACADEWMQDMWDAGRER